MKVSECKAQKCPHLGRIYNKSCQQNNGPFYCLKTKHKLIKDLNKCPKDSKRGAL